MEKKKSQLVIGIGNEYRCDDGLGVHVVRLLQQASLPKGVEFMAFMKDGISLVDAWSGRDQVILIDAVCSGVTPGTLHHVILKETAIPQQLGLSSTHSISIIEAFELAKALGQLPKSLVFYGIEGTCFEQGTGLSPEVQEAVPLLLERIMQELAF